MRRLFLAPFFLFVSLGCSSGSFELGSTEGDGSLEAGDDSGVFDSESDATLDDTAEDIGRDSSAPDSGKLDSGKVDTGIVDSGKLDTGIADSGKLDTGAVDTGVVDTGLVDTGLVDTGHGDGGAMDGGGAVCPAPPSTKTYAVTDSCTDLQSKIVAVVAEARPCTCDADCSVAIEKDFCGCTTYVNPGRDAYRLAVAMHERWKALACTTMCPLIPCAMPVEAKCVSKSGSSEKVCQDGYGL